jgi:hypothetical protein
MRSPYFASVIAPARVRHRRGEAVAGDSTALADSAATGGLLRTSRWRDPGCILERPEARPVRRDPPGCDRRLLADHREHLVADTTRLLGDHAGLLLVDHAFLPPSLVWLLTTHSAADRFRPSIEQALKRRRASVR